jgi:hypothetical protein
MSILLIKRVQSLPEELENKIWKMVHGLDLYKVINEFTEKIEYMKFYNEYASKYDIYSRNYNELEPIDDLTLIKKIKEEFLHSAPINCWHKLGMILGIQKYTIKYKNLQFDNYWGVYGSGW